jgi:tetratricopeptide (TPR) repeat protein
MISAVASFALVLVLLNFGFWKRLKPKPSPGPNDAGTLIDRAMTLFNESRWSEALDDLDAALKLDPQNARAYTNRGLIRIFGGHAQAA